MKRASFINHKVTPEGVYVRGLTSPGLMPDIEILVPRDDAEEFGWIDSEDELPAPTEEPNAEARHLRSIIATTVVDLEMLISAHDMDMTQRAFEKVQDILAALKRSVATEKPAQPTDPEQEKMLKKLAEWNAMSQRG